MQENHASTKADFRKENKHVNPTTTANESSKSYIKLPNMKKISECENTGLPTKTAEPAPGYQISND